MKREEAIEWLKTDISRLWNTPMNSLHKEALGMAIKALEQEPIQPKAKVGKWIKYGRPRCDEQHYQCTVCNYYINFGKWGDLYTKEFRYCPNCGAKMEVDNG